MENVQLHHGAIVSWSPLLVKNIDTVEQKRTNQARYLRIWLHEKEYR